MQAFVFLNLFFFFQISRNFGVILFFSIAITMPLDVLLYKLCNISIYYISVCIGVLFIFLS